MKSRSHAMPWGSRPLDGSSRMRTSGSPMRAVASSSRWRMPMEKPPTLRLASRRQADQVEHLVGALARRGRRRGPPCADGCAPGVPGGSWSPPARRRRCPTGSRGPGSRARRWWPCPAEGWTRPSSMRSVVVLPDPLGPRKPVTRPGSTVKDRLSTASTGPKCLDSPLISMGRPRVGAPTVIAATLARASGVPVVTPCASHARADGSDRSRASGGQAVVRRSTSSSGSRSRTDTASSS